MEEQPSQLREANRRERAGRDQSQELAEKVARLEGVLENLEREKRALAKTKSRLESDNR